MKLGNTLRTIESSQGCWNERRAGCATMKPLVCCHRFLAARAVTVSTHSSILLHSKLLSVGIYSLRYLGQFLSQRILAICVNAHVSRCRAHRGRRSELSENGGLRSGRSAGEFGVSLMSNIQRTTTSRQCCGRATSVLLYQLSCVCTIKVFFTSVSSSPLLKKERIGK